MEHGAVMRAVAARNGICESLALRVAASDARGDFT